MRALWRRFEQSARLGPEALSFFVDGNGHGYWFIVYFRILKYFFLLMRFFRAVVNAFGQK